jgi:hypothetical protein
LALCVSCADMAGISAQRPEYTDVRGWRAN